MADRPEPGPGGPTVFVACLGVAVGLAVLLPVPGPPPAWQAAGIVPVALGTGLHWWAWRTFAAGSVAVEDRAVPETLVTDGPYRWSRNPMLLGGLLILVGAAALLGSFASFAPVPVYAWICQRSFVIPEERILAERFGPAYLEYRSRVRRWI